MRVASRMTTIMEFGQIIIKPFLTHSHFLHEPGPNRTKSAYFIQAMGKDLRYQPTLSLGITSTSSRFLCWRTSMAMSFPVALSGWDNADLFYISIGAHSCCSPAVGTLR
jgi:hypothetical protein